MSPPTLQIIAGKDTYKYNTTQATQYDMSPHILQTTGGKDPYKYNTTQHNTNNTIRHELS